jgi:uncharacterized protein YbcI
MSIPSSHESAGKLLAEISNAVVRVFSECYGRGPTKAKTYMVDNYVFTVLEELLTTVEETLVNAGRSELVREVRLAFQAEMADRFKSAVEEVTGRTVVAYHSQLVFDPTMAFEIFVLEPEDEDEPTA